MTTKKLQAWRGKFRFTNFSQQSSHKDSGRWCVSPCRIRDLLTFHAFHYGIKYPPHVHQSDRSMTEIVAILEASARHQCSKRIHHCGRSRGLQKCEHG